MRASVYPCFLHSSGYCCWSSRGAAISNEPPSEDHVIGMENLLHRMPVFFFLFSFLRNQPPTSLPTIPGMAIPLALLFRWKMCCTTLTTISPPFLFFPSPIPTIFPSVSYLLHLREGGISSKFKKEESLAHGREGKGRGGYSHMRERESACPGIQICV